MSTVLVIEDDQNLREGLELLLQIEGYRTLGASNGLQGIAIARRERPDVILTNFQMPGADGFEVLQVLRSDSVLGSTPILFLTADHHPTVREKAVRDGADAFVTKPFETDELLRMVAAFTSRVGHEEST